MAIETESYRKAKKKKAFKYDQDRDMLQRYLEDAVYYLKWIGYLLILGVLVLIGIFLAVITG